MGRTKYDNSTTGIPRVHELLRIIRARVCTPAKTPAMLKVGRKEGKAGSKKRIEFGESERQAFEAIQLKLQESLELYNVNPDTPFVLRVDAIRWAVGAALEQFTVPQEGMPTKEQVMELKRVPVAFCSRKLTKSHFNWTPREKETYAIILALEKWISWIGFQPVLVLTDHKSLEN